MKLTLSFEGNVALKNIVCLEPNDNISEPAISEPGDAISVFLRENDVDDEICENVANKLKPQAFQPEGSSIPQTSNTLQF